MTNLKQKILYLITQSEWGGAQEYVFNLATNLDKNKFEVLVLAGEGDDQLFKELEKQNIRYQKLKYVKRGINPYFDIKAYFEIKNIIKNERPNIIHLNSSKMSVLGGLVVPKIQFELKYKIKVIYTAHGWVFNERPPLYFLWISDIYFQMEKQSAKKKNVIITVCKSDEQIALKNNFKTKIINIHNAVNLNKLNFLAKEEAIKKFIKSPILIGTIANLYQTKGLNYLIESAKLLTVKYPDYKFIIIGEGHERKNLENLIKKYNLTDTVILTGNIPQAHRYLKAFDLFVLPSIKEGLPYTLLKAIAAEILIVATNVGGIPEIIDNNYLVEPTNPQDLADKIKQTLNHPDIQQNHHAPDFNEFLNRTIELYK